MYFSYLYSAIFHMPFCLVNFNRVILSMLPGVENSDYINASYINVSLKQNFFNIIYIMTLTYMQGYGRNKMYIAAQGKVLIINYYLIENLKLVVK